MRKAETTLTDFLLARLDEGEAAAKRAASDPVAAMEEHFMCEALYEERDWKSWPERDTSYSHGQADAMRWASAVIRERMKPLSLHDPARVLREVGAGRALIAEHGPARGGRDADRCRVCTAIAHGHATRFRSPCPTLRFLAAIYSDHPDYREEWKP